MHVHFRVNQLHSQTKQNKNKVTEKKRNSQFLCVNQIYFATNQTINQSSRGMERTTFDLIPARSPSYGLLLSRRGAT